MGSTCCGGLRPGVDKPAFRPPRKRTGQFINSGLEGTKRYVKMAWKNKKYTLGEYDKVKRFSFYLGDEHFCLLVQKKMTIQTTWLKR